MGIRITTWNVNGIRNPFGYQPWRDKRTFEGMFDVLEADIVVFQETKIQRKDLRDDMVLVPGFDCYWSLPKHKKGYSGVVIYTRNERCAPIRAEEGITGILTPPNTSTSFRDLPDEEQIGGYPNTEQLTQTEFDAATLDSEGRCVILEFPAFVLIGTYCPAERDETRTHFRTGFLKVLDARIRNLVKMGKKVIWTGDLNISREEIDTAMAEEAMRKNGVDAAEWISTPARRLFNQLLVGGRVHGDRDEGREEPCMWDVCRSFHPDRKGMYTCWDTKTNARPGNFGARIDYVVSSYDMKDWFSDSNIQEGLHGSDHCPVYAVLKDKVEVEGTERHTLDILNPQGMFENGIRQQPWTAKNLLPTSGKLIQEFDRRRNIKDMFAQKPSIFKRTGNIDQKPSIPKITSNIDQKPPTSTMTSNIDQKPSIPKTTSNVDQGTVEDLSNSFSSKIPDLSPISITTDVTSKDGTAMRSKSPARSTSPTKPSTGKRSKPEASAPAKRLKTNQDTNGKGQKTLKGFFKAKTTAVDETSEAPSDPASTAEVPTASEDEQSFDNGFPSPISTEKLLEDEAASFTSRQSWGKLFSKPIPPKCDHDEPCKSMLTKKPGVNQGRSFWMCNRPLGPNGKQEKGTQWRCSTFIWCSDWDQRTG